MDQPVSRKEPQKAQNEISPRSAYEPSFCAFCASLWLNNPEINQSGGQAIAEFARNRLQAKTAAIILDPKNDYAVVLAGFFSEAFPAVTGKITLDANRNAHVPVYMLRIDQGKYSYQAAQETRKPSQKVDVLFVPLCGHQLFLRS